MSSNDLHPSAVRSKRMLYPVGGSVKVNAPNAPGWAVLVNKRKIRGRCWIQPIVVAQDPTLADGEFATAQVLTRSGHEPPFPSVRAHEHRLSRLKLFERKKLNPARFRSLARIRGVHVLATPNLSESQRRAYFYQYRTSMPRGKQYMAT